MGIPVLIATCTADGDGYCQFLSGIDSTYDEYMFVCTDINPVTDNTHFQFQVNVAGQSGFNETITSTFFSDYHNEANNSAGITYHADYDQAQGTEYQALSREIGNGADESTAGILHLFAPSNTTYTTQFYSRFSGYVHDDGAKGGYMSGYFNVTGAVDEVSFAMSAGAMDGVVQMYGIK